MSIIMLPKVENITIISGDYTGYILNMDNIKQVSIIKDNKIYYFKFINTEYFTEEKIEKLLATIVIN